ncbi:RraA family protein [Muricoccus radiodurans]|uniref:RraA family protein n=1 Tax=Muricoccus radiodurans TaxID=2231721 RepID=UPI003CE7EBA9
MAIGLRISEQRRAAEDGLIARASRLPVANIGDVMNRMQAMRGGFLCYGGRKTIVGHALTVKARQGDNLFLHRAIDLARPGDVIVCDGAGDMVNALAGDLMIGHAVSRGVGALVIDGAVRDIAQLRDMDIGVWARGTTPGGPWKDGPGEIGYPVACGGQVVMTDDLIAADEDGIVVIPSAAAAEVIAAAEAHAAKENETTAAIAKGGWDRSWVTKTLAEKGLGS